HFGGHPMAAGMTLSIEDVDILRNRINQLAEVEITQKDFMPIVEVDAVCQIDDLSLKALEEIMLFAPFGMANTKPIITLPNVQIKKISQVGGNQQHLKMTVHNKVKAVDVIGFGLGDAYEQISPSATISLLGEPSINEWN